MRQFLTISHASSIFWVCCKSLLFIGSIGLHSLCAQNEPLLSSSGRQPLIEVLNEWEQKHDFVFSYDVKAIVQTPKFKKLPPPEALEQILDGSGLTFTQMDEKFFVIKKKLITEPTSQAPPPSKKEPPKPNIIYKTKVYPSFQGQVFLEGKESMLELTAVFIKGKEIGAYTDSLGFFTINGDFSSQDTLMISRMGYEPQFFLMKKLMRQKNWVATLDLMTQTLDQIEIAGKAIQPIETQEQELGIRIDPKKIAALPGWGEPDVIQMLQLLPGVNSSGGASADISIRGGSPDQNLVLWDDIPLLHTGHFFGIFSITNPYLVDHAQTYLGDFGAEYGDRVAAVIDIKSRADSITRFERGGSINLINTQGYMAIPLFKKRGAL